MTHGDGPLLVVAGAGTGKTQVITRRIAWLIATRRAGPSEILALTFTDKAADEMQAPRGPARAVRLHGHARSRTFHAFGDRLIREFALELGLPGDVRVLSRPETSIFLREHLFELELDEYRPLGDPTRFLGALATLFSRVQGRGRLAGRVPRVRRAAARPRPARRPRRAAPEPDATRPRRSRRRRGASASSRGAYARYQELLARERASIDFGDQVALALRLAARVAGRARAAIQARFRYILVDEFQDTNRAQSELVALLAEPHRNVTVVGDDDQSIYRFRGAAISNILEFRDRYRGARIVVLRRNYRSRAADPRRRLPAHPLQRSGPARGPGRDRQAARAGARGPRRRTRSAHEAFATGAEEADWIAAEIGRRIAAGARAARPRRPRPHERRRRPDPAQPQPRRDPVAVLGHVRAVCAAGGAAPARRSCAPSPTSGRRASTCTPSPRRSSTASAART